MRIVIDMQGAQTTGSRHRGIGRYTLSLSKEITRLRGKHKVILALNGLFSETIEPLRAAFAGLLPEEDIHVWEVVDPVNAIEPSNDTRIRAAQLTREAFLASLRPDVVLVTSLFEGLIDDAVTSIGNFANTFPTAMILYDLIPLIHRGIYLQNPLVERWYLNKIDYLRRADLLLSISESSGYEAIQNLGFPVDKVVNISTACDSQFQPLVVDESKRAHLERTYGLVRPFVMYTGGIDHRKNIEGLIRAYARLPKSIRKEHQLAVVCSVQDADRERLQTLANKEGMAGDEVLITGFVSEADLLALYNSCKLFVFPSWHEGFGLPALEAMACGRAVIGANTSSVPEVIGRKDALFDPYDDEAIAKKIKECLSNDHFRSILSDHAIKHAKKFSWEQTARRALGAMEQLVSARGVCASNSGHALTTKRPRLAYISPLPPEKSGISDYSAELLPELTRYYDVEVVVAQKEVSDPWILANCMIRDVTWFCKHAQEYDRILYHFGNSPFHGYMFELLAQFPGVVVLHDFFLSHIVGHLDYLGVTKYAVEKALISAHGWHAIQAYCKEGMRAAYAYPCNTSVLRQALGVIVHSEYSRRLVREWHGVNAENDWTVIPLMRVSAISIDRTEARRVLGLKDGDFVICSFGHLGESKLNHRLLASWLASPLARDPRCHLVFVGENPGGEYGDEFALALNGRSARQVKVTGWVDTDRYKTWLSAADIGVQLRTQSRGETSAAVLDCLNYGLATIVNANGSMENLPENVVWRLSDEFLDQHLTEALTALWGNEDHRLALGREARLYVRSLHSPRKCAEQYRNSIERYYSEASLGLLELVNSVSNLNPSLDGLDLPALASALSNNFPPYLRRKKFLLDISILVQHDARSGIQRVVRALLLELLINPPKDWAVEPVYATPDMPSYRYARKFTCRFLGINDEWAEDAPVDAWSGDVFIGLDLQHITVPAKREYLATLRHRGIRLFFVVYDLLPVTLPQVFPDGTREMHQRWLEVISEFDGALCISRSVADEFYDWLGSSRIKRLRPFVLNWFHLGADVENSMPSKGLPEDANQVLDELKVRPSFLVVGTIEPRKGHAQVLGGFEELWREGVDVNLVLVGKRGWKVEGLVAQLENHPERNKRLFWLEGISDEYLEKIYGNSTGLIAASLGEGFGLPLIEAAQHKLPIIARDIKVFREVAGEYAFYFLGKDCVDFSNSIKDWLILYKKNNHPKSDKIPWLTWRQSAESLVAQILSLDIKPYKIFL